MNAIQRTEEYDAKSLGTRQPPPPPQQQQHQNRQAANTSTHRRLGSLTQVTNKLRSDQNCPIAWLTQHPEAYPTARVQVSATLPHFNFEKE